MIDLETLGILKRALYEGSLFQAGVADLLWVGSRRAWERSLPEEVAALDEFFFRRDSPIVRGLYI